MSVIFPPAPRTIWERLFGRKVQYICDLPLEDCLEQLQSKSERGSGIFADARKILITIIYENRNEYAFVIERYIPVSKGISRIYIGGTLQRIDAQHTSVTVDSTQLHTVLAKIIFFYAIPLFPFVAIFVASLAWGVAPLQMWVDSLGLGLFVSGMLYWATLYSERRLWRELAVCAFQALPPT
jgi:hypothetical protein